jgi:hypothetical protein
MTIVIGRNGCVYPHAIRDTGRERGSARCQVQKSSTGKFHPVPHR